jgi:hypothetical protein
MEDNLSEHLFEFESEPLGACVGPSAPAITLAPGADHSLSGAGTPGNGVGVVVRRLMGLLGRRIPLVDPGSDPIGIPLPSRSTVPLTESDVGAEVVVAFEHGDPNRPVVLGKLWGGPDTPSVAPPEGATPVPWVVQSDGHRLVIAADLQLELRCGDASIILTSAGKVLIRGEYLSSRSSGVNRIQGGSVHIN